jgi:hypothetical protein
MHRALLAMEDEVDLEPAMEARLIDGVTRELRAQEARRRRRLFTFTGAGALALAACVAVILGWPRQGALPAYGLSVPGDAQVLGSAPAQTITQEATKLTVDSTLRVELRPRERVSGRVQAVPYLWRPGGDEPRRWGVELQQADSGTLLLQAPVRALPELGPGRFSLIFAVGPAGAEAPAPAQITEALRATRGEGARVGPFQVLSRDVEIAPTAP